MNPVPGPRHHPPRGVGRRPELDRGRGDSLGTALPEGEVQVGGEDGVLPGPGPLIPASPQPQAPQKSICSTLHAPDHLAGPHPSQPV